MRRSALILGVVLLAGCGGATVEAKKPKPPRTTVAVTTTTVAPTTTTTSPPTTAPAAFPWLLRFEDNFDYDVARGEFLTDPDSTSRWNSYGLWADTSRLGFYDAERVLSVGNGVLTKHLHYFEGGRRGAAIGPRIPGNPDWVGFTHMRVEIRWRADTHLSNYKTAWLLWPDSNNWDEGEIDFVERSLGADSVFAFTHHKYPRAASNWTQDPQDWAQYTPFDGNQWHTSVVEWTPGTVRYFTDGVLFGEHTTAVPDTPFHLVVQTESEPTYAADNTQAGIVEIDYVKVWSYAP